MHSLGTDMYIAPWTRILPYIIGVGAGYAMFTFNGVMPLGKVSVTYDSSLGTLRLKLVFNLFTENHQNHLDGDDIDRNHITHIDIESRYFTLLGSSFDNIHPSILSSINIMDDRCKSNGSWWIVC